MAIVSNQVGILLNEQDTMRLMILAFLNVASQVTGEAASTVGRDERHNFAAQVFSQDPLNASLPFWRVKIAAALEAAKGSIDAIGDIRALTAQGNTDRVNIVIAIWNDLSGVKAT